MKLRNPQLKLIRDTRQRQEILAMTSCRQIKTSLTFFQFKANLEQTGRLTPVAWSVKLTFLLIAPFYLTKAENITKKISNTTLILLP